MIAPTAYWPSIGYLRWLCMSPQREIHWSTNESYQKQTWRNRCLILSANGELRMSVPVRKTKGHRSTTADIILDPEKKWKKEHWRAMESAYRHAPYFEHYESDLKRIFFKDHHTLLELNQSIVSFFINHLQLPINIHLSETTVFPSFPNYSADQIPQYNQVFPSESISTLDISFADALFNLGPMSRKLLFPIKINS